MLPKKLILKDYLTFDQAEIDFQNIRKALIIGIRNNNAGSSCGSGKSNLLRSIPWCLWGINPEAKDIDQNVRWGTDFCSVQFDFTHLKEDISVIRTRNVKTNKSTLDLYINGVHSNGNTIADTTKKITEKINLDYNAYINSCYIRQNDIHSLVNSDDKDASRELFERLMGLDVYDGYQEAAEAIVADLEQQRDELFEFIRSNANAPDLIEEQQKIITISLDSINANKAFVLNHREQIDAKNSKYDSLKLNIGSKENVVKNLSTAKIALERMRTDVNRLVNTCNLFKGDIINRRKQYEDVIAGQSSILTQLEAWEKKVTDGEAAQAKASEIEVSIVSKREEVAALQKSVNGIESRVGILQHDAKKAKSEIDEITNKISNPSIAIGSKCDSCLTDITENTVEHYVSHLNSDIFKKSAHIESLKSAAQALKPKHAEDKNKIDDLHVEISTLTVDKDALLKLHIGQITASSTRNLLNKNLEAVSTAKEDLARLEKSHDIEDMEASIQKQTLDMATQQSLVDDLAAKVDSTYEQDDAEIKKLKAEIDGLQSSIISIEGDVVLLNSKIDMAKSKISDFDIIKQKLVDDQVNLSDIEQQLITARELVIAFSPKGIRYHILGKAIEELERESNLILPTLSQGNLRIRFQTKKEIKKSKRGDQEKLVFDAFINDGQKEQPFSSYSGGEQFMISFVVRVALSNMLLKRANTDLQFLVIDEAISPLDQAGMDLIIPTINELQAYFKVILVITHRSEVKQHFEEVITIKRNKYVSHIEA